MKKMIKAFKSLRSAGSSSQTDDQGEAQAGPTQTTTNPNDLLLIAARKGDVDRVIELLDVGNENGKANINFKDEHGATALFYASLFDKSDVVTLLLDKGADVNSVQNDGSTALIAASDYGRSKVVTKLLEAGANLDLANSAGSTALILASSRGYDKVVEQLLGAKANVDLALSDGVTPLMLASQGGLSGRHEIVGQLLGAKANVDLASVNGVNALMLASKNGHLDIVTKLLGAGANKDQPNNDGETALMLASAYGHFKDNHGHHRVVKELLEAKADIDLVDKDGKTAIMLASENGHKKIAQTLIDAGAQRPLTSAEQAAKTISKGLSSAGKKLGLSFGTGRGRVAPRDEEDIDSPLLSYASREEAREKKVVVGHPERKVYEEAIPVLQKGAIDAGDEVTLTIGVREAGVINAEVFTAKGPLEAETTLTTSVAGTSPAASGRRSEAMAEQTNTQGR